MKVDTRKTYLISDTHLGDNENGIIKFERRPFTSRNDMIEKFIINWNSVVKVDDKVYHLGDVFWGMSDEERKSIISRLNGEKYLVMGNHDRDKSTEYWRSLGFKEAYDLPVILNNFIILSHESLYMVDGPYVNIFGHVHGNKSYKDVSEISFCVCPERKLMNYTPISLYDALDYIQKARDEGCE